MAESPLAPLPQRFHLGITSMDQTHREFLDLYQRLLACSPADFTGRFTTLAEHTQAHFAAEDALMRAHGFPATAEHSGEHQRILGEFARFGAQCAAGRTQMARAWAREQIKDWFEIHLSTMDSALAAHLKRVA